MNWQTYMSILAGTVGVIDRDAEYPMDTFRPCADDDEADDLAEEMNAASYVGDGIDYVPASKPIQSQPEDSR